MAVMPSGLNSGLIFLLPERNACQLRIEANQDG